jgi:hypothetical protein
MIPINDLNQKQKEELIKNIPDYMLKRYGEQLRKM